MTVFAVECDREIYLCKSSVSDDLLTSSSAGVNGKMYSWDLKSEEPCLMMDLNDYGAKDDLSYVDIIRARASCGQYFVRLTLVDASAMLECR